MKMRYLWLACLLVFTVAKADPIVVGFGFHKPPYIFENQRTGLEFELVEAAFKAAAIEIQPFFASQGRLHAMMEMSQLDAIVTTNEQSGVKAYYSDVYIIYRNYAISLAKRKLKIDVIEDLSSYSITAFQRAYTNLGPRYQSAVDQSLQYVEQAQQKTRNLMLFSGRVDVAIGDKRIFGYFNNEISNEVDATQPTTYHDIFPPTPYKVAFRNVATRDRFNKGLAEIRKNGTYTTIEKKYSKY